MSSLIGKVAIVTGSSRGIGSIIAKDLAKEGCSLVVNYSGIDILPTPLTLSVWIP